MGVTLKQIYIFWHQVKLPVPQMCCILLNCWHKRTYQNPQTSHSLPKIQGSLHKLMVSLSWWEQCYISHWTWKIHTLTTGMHFICSQRKMVIINITINSQIYNDAFHELYPGEIAVQTLWRYHTTYFDIEPMSDIDWMTKTLSQNRTKGWG